MIYSILDETALTDNQFFESQLIRFKENSLYVDVILVCKSIKLIFFSKFLFIFNN